MKNTYDELDKQKQRIYGLISGISDKGLELAERAKKQADEKNYGVCNKLNERCNILYGRSKNLFDKLIDIEQAKNQNIIDSHRSR